MERVIYLHGFASGPGSKKARLFRERLARVECPDLAEGDFEHLTITRQLAVIERTARGEPVTLIGSSMGGYLAALYAARHAEVRRLVLLAPAFGFAHRWPERLGAEVTAEWERSGSMAVFHYADGVERRVGWELMADGRKYESYPNVRQPALIIHGRNDDVVPCAFSEEFAATRPWVDLEVVESGHELTDVQEFIWQRSREFLRCTV